MANLEKTVVVNRLESTYDVYVGRPSKWGNPYRIGVHGSRKEVIEKYRRYIFSNTVLLRSLPELKGKILGCWCKPLPCHGDVLAELANGIDNDKNI
jgi:hypothetical protein